jgi:DUF4097 and DUF4098 domain-containing protein YvlB
MKKLVALFLAVPLCIWLVQANQTVQAAQKSSHSHSSNLTMNDDPSTDDCAAHMRMYNDDFKATARDEETRSVPNSPLKITAEHNGGIQVTGWDGADFSIKLCKQVAANDEARARQVLAATHLEVSSSTVTVRSVDSDDDHSLGTLIIVKAPRNATLSLSVHNGGVSLNGFTGTADAHAQNGGISLKHSSGTITAEAQNGGISLKDCGGDVTLNVQNGGLSISVPERWEGKGLEANTHNGGLSIDVPKNLQTGVEVVGSEHTSIICKDDVCGSAERTWDNGHKILRFGPAGGQIKATTVNGGVVVQSKERARAEL